MRFKFWALVGGCILIVLIAACNQLPDETSSGLGKGDNQRSNAPGPPCDHAEWSPYRHVRLMCNESVYDNVTVPEAAPALYGMDIAPDGTLYFVRSAAGEIWAMRDDDGDQFMDAPFLVVDGLRLPTQISVQDDALLVSAAGGLYRLPATGPNTYGEPERLLEQAQNDAQSWPGAVHVSPDGRIYLGLGANADEPGKIISLAPDGTEQRVIATGLHQANDFTWHPATGDLWILDDLPDQARDVLLRVPAGTDTVLDFGYPRCTNGTASDCADITPPAYHFAPQANPVGLQFYTGMEWTFWYGDLFVTLGGSWNANVPRGYALMAIDFDDNFQSTRREEILLPSSESRYTPYNIFEFSLTGKGFYPYHPADIVIDDQGWLYIGVQEGRILRVRPRPANRPGGPQTPTPPRALITPFATYAP